MLRDVLLAGAVAGMARLAWRTRPRRVVVEGRSMVPALQPGDRLLVRRTASLGGGDIVAFPDPRDGTRTLIKRVRTVDDAGVDVRGDNPGASTDSRTFGPVLPGAIIGRIVYRYAPPARAGRLAGGGQGVAARRLSSIAAGPAVAG